jgi:trans-aconitate 2-methyltransferase
MKTDTWNPTQYEKFKSERSQPFYDLLNLIKRDQPIDTVVDLGCGTGELTKALHQTLKAKNTLGTDNSANMLTKAEAFSGEGLTFINKSIPEFHETKAYDVVFSNAALQWCDNHPQLLRNIRDALKPGGQLAIQMPMNHDHPTHRIANEVAAREPYASALNQKGGTREVALLKPEDYAQLLFDLGFHKQSVSLRVYSHILDSREGAVEWVKGTLLTYYQSRFPTDLYEAYLADYIRELFKYLPNTRPFFYPFKRILIWGAL